MTDQQHTEAAPEVAIPDAQPSGDGFSEADAAFLRSLEAREGLAEAGFEVGEAAPEAEAPASEEQQTTDATPPREEASETEVDAASLERSLAALRGEGWSTDDLEGLEDAKLLRLGERAIELRNRRQAEFERSRVEAARKDEQTDEEGSAGEPRPHPSDLSGIAQPLAEELGLTEDGAGKLEKAFGDLAAQVVEQVKGSYESQIRQANALANHTALELQRTRLEGRYPSLADDGTWAKVQEKVGTLAKSGSYQGNPSGLFQDAIRLAGVQAAPASDPAASERARQEAARKNAGQLTPSGREVSQQPATQEEAEFDFFRSLERKYGVSD